MKKLILEMRLNEYKLKSANANIPYTPDEIAQAAFESRKAGASIVHFHARENDGAACFSPEVYAECAAKIREKCDILIDVTLGQVNVQAMTNVLLILNLWPSLKKQNLILQRLIRAAPTLMPTTISKKNSNQRTVHMSIQLIRAFT